MKRLAFAIVSTLWLISCASGPKFEQLEYYKNAAKWRVFVYVTPDATMEQIKEHARKQMYTPGKTTDVYYYRSNPGFTPYSVTNASNAIEAQKLASRPGCVLRYQKGPNEDEYFVEMPNENAK